MALKFKSYLKPKARQPKCCGQNFANDYDLILDNPGGGSTPPDPGETFRLQLESGDFILQENNDYILLETAP